MTIEELKTVLPKNIEYTGGVDVNGFVNYVVDTFNTDRFGWDVVEATVTWLSKQDYCTKDRMFYALKDIFGDASIGLSDAEIIRFINPGALNESLLADLTLEDIKNVTPEISKWM